MIASRAGRATGWRALLVLGLALTCAAAGAADVAAPVLGYRVVATYPHDVGAFTQGLLLHDGALYESLGGYGESRLRRVELASGRVLAERALDRRLFAEGLALADGRLYQLTWRAGVGFVYDAQTFAPLGRFRYPGEGWG